MALLPILAWWVASVILIVLGAPAAIAISPSEGRGLGYALPVSVAALTVLGLWVGHLTLGIIWLILPSLMLVALAVVIYRFVDVDINHAAAAESVGLFTLAYAGYLLLRTGAPGVRPDGEQFLDYGLLMAILRAPALPPEDMWFAGEPVQYYYGGHLVVAHLVELTGVHPRYAFHLAIASTLAAVVVASYELGGAIAAETSASRFVGGLGAATIVGIGGHAAAIGWLTDPFAPVVEEATAFALPGAVAVFPLLEALEGTMHAHVLVAPLLVLAAAVAHRMYLDPDTPTVPVIAASGTILAALVVTSTWAAPTALGIFFLAAVLAHPPEDRAPLQSRDRYFGMRKRVGRATEVTVGASLLGAFLAVPFLLGSGRVYGVDIVGPTNRSGIVPLLQVYGGLIAIFLAFILSRTDRTGLRVFGVALAVGVVFLITPGNLAVVGLVVAACAVPIYHHLGDRSASFGSVLLIAGAGLVLLVEFVYVLTDGPGNRFNTVFKTSMHVWLLWGIAAGSMLGPIRDRARTHLPRSAAIAIVLALLVPSLAYGLIAVPDHYRTSGELTLDGTATITAQHPAEMAAINKLGSYVTGQPTMVSAPGDRKYRWSASPAASLTGIPTVAGWSHEAQYRSPDAYWARVEQVDAFYTGNPSTQVAFLQRYRVQYIYVGPTERQRYGELPQFEALPGVQVAFYNSVVTVYAVDHDRLGTNSAELSRRPPTTMYLWLGTARSVPS